MYSFKDYLIKNYDTKIYSIIKQYYFSNKDRLDFSTKYIPQPNFSCLQEIMIFNVFFSTTNIINKIVFYVGVHADFLVKGKTIDYYKNKYYDEDTKRLDFTITFTAILQDGLKELKALDVDEYTKKPYKEGTTLSKYLVPYFSIDGMEKRAEEFLKQYCPEVLVKPMRIPIHKVLDLLKLKVFTSPLPDDIFGRTYFVDSNEQIFNEEGNIVTKLVKKGTILINPYASFMEDVGSEMNTIIHECIHWKYHRNFFELQRLLNPDDKFMSCIVVDKYIIDDKLAEEIKWMEWQANQLAPRIIMPENTTKQKYIEVMNNLLIDNPNTSKAVLCENTIEILSNFFNVSISAMKVRLAQLGIKEAVGTYCYVDGKRIKPYFFSHENSKNLETYLIDFVDAVLLLNNKNLLKKLVYERKIIYANGFLVLNNTKYVTLNDEGTFELNDYAREHVDECCLKFKIVQNFNDKNDPDFYSMCFLCRNVKSKDNIYTDIDEQDIQNSKIIGVTGETSFLYEEIEEAEELIKKMNGTFADSLNLLINHYDIRSNQEIGDMMGVDEAMIRKYRRGEKEPDLRRILGLCCGLELYPNVSNRLLLNAGIVLGNRGKEIDMIYLTLLWQCYHEGVVKWNERIKELLPNTYEQEKIPQ